MKKIVFTGGGTLGHCMPNLYLIDSLNDYTTAYIAGNGIEKSVAEKQVNRYYTIPTVKLVRGKFWTNLKIPFILLKAIKQSKKILKEEKPDIIFSKGGYVSLPVCLAAKQLKIPIIAHESDFSFGLANKIILKLCDKMCVNFENLQNKHKKCVYTGPIFNKNFYFSNNKPKNINLHENKKTILIVCGSLGSKTINDSFASIIKDLIKDFNIVHITGKGNKTKSFENYNSFEMYEDMTSLYNIADFVVGRSGAGVTAECFFKKLPMLLIPLENKATRGDQLLNAKYYEKQGVAVILREPDLTPTGLLKCINNLSSNLELIKNKYSKIPQKNGLDAVIKLIETTKK